MPDRLRGEPQALFVYGTLQFPEVLKALLGRVPELSPAAASGWRIAALPGRSYPGLVPGQGVAQGFLITGLSREEWLILDAFEDDFYDLAEITLSEGRTGWSYVCPADYPVAAEDWTPDAFTLQYLENYATETATWRATLPT